MMQTKIISAFPGTGKSTYHSKHRDTTLDSDSSGFSWLEVGGGPSGMERVRHPDFPSNYLRHISSQYALGRYAYIFVSSHKEVRDALLSAGLFFYVFVPRVSMKDEYIARYRQRGNDESFIEKVSTHWESWLSDFQEAPLGCKYIVMSSSTLEEELVRRWG